MVRQSHTIWLFSALHGNNLIHRLNRFSASRGKQRLEVSILMDEVKNMKMKNWTLNTNKVRAWAENQPKSDNLNAVLLSLTLGDNAGTDELRSTYWTAIRSIGSTMEGFPSARRGRESTLTEEQELVLATVEESVAAAIAQIPTESQDMILSVIVPHGRTGGVYGSFSELVDSYRSKAHSYMIKSIKENRWDGLKVDKNGVPVIEPSPVKADMEVSEEE